MRELLAILKDVKAGVFSLAHLPSFLLWFLFDTISQVFL